MPIAISSVLVVRLRGRYDGDGDTGLNAVSTGSSITNWQSVYTSLNGKPLSRYASPSLYSYLKEVSAGRCRIQSIVPQMSDDGRTVTYLTLPGSRDSYVAHSSVVEAAVNAFNACYPETDLSGLADNGEGYISNVLVIPETGDVVPEVGTTLWSRRLPRRAVGTVPKARPLGRLLYDCRHHARSAYGNNRP